jgi:hypothetical protein
MRVGAFTTCCAVAVAATRGDREDFAAAAGHDDLPHRLSQMHGNV